MNTVETIVEAIEKLEKLRFESTQPTDGNAWIQGSNSRRYESPKDIYTGPDSSTPGSADIVTYIEPADAALIVALHRTIDAQLVILRNLAVPKAAMWKGPHMPEQLGSYLSLARAILGEVSS